MKKQTVDPAIAKIRATRGLPIKVAKACGIDRQAVYQWRKVPPRWVHIVAKMIKLKPKTIRPDIFR